VPVLAQFPHDGEFVDEALLAVLSIEAALFGKGLDCKLGVVSDAFHFVNRGEVALSKFFEGFEHLMEAFLVDVSGKHKNPSFDDTQLGREEADGGFGVVEKAESNF